MHDRHYLPRPAACAARPRALLPRPAARRAPRCEPAEDLRLLPRGVLPRRVDRRACGRAAGEYVAARAERCARECLIAPHAFLARVDHSDAELATCADYPNQAAAQRAADTRDADADGIYCEDLPCPCSTAGDGGTTTTHQRKLRLGRAVTLGPVR